MSDPKRTSVTLKDVARAAGVSYQTVSRAINDHPEINSTTRQKILLVTKQLGYRPNRLAGSLRTNQSKVLGLIVSDIENVFFAEVAAGVEAEARSQGYSVILANSGEDIAREREAVTSLFERRVDGLIIAPTEGSHSYLKSELPKKFPVVAINRRIDSPRYGGVFTQNDVGARIAVEYLIRRGHTKIGVIVASVSLSTSRERMDGFRAAMEAAKLPINPDWVATGTLRPDGARRAATEIFSMGDRPTAMLTSSHRVSEGLLFALRDLGLQHGRDVEIVGDYVPWAPLINPPLVSLVQPTNRIGEEAVRMIVGMVSGARGPSVVRLPVRLLTHTKTDLPASA